MQKLICEICGGSLIMNADNIAECESCGMKYSKEKIVQMVKIEGAVEITKGEAEKERLLKNAETYLNLEKHKEAYELCQQITKEYPDDYRSWYLAFKSGVYALAKNSFPLSRTENNLTVVDSHLATAIKLSENKDEFGREAIRFWYDVLCQEDTNFVNLYNLRRYNNCGENHVLSIFLRKIDEKFSLLVNQLNSFQNKKEVCEKLGFHLIDFDYGTTIKSITAFSFSDACIYTNGIIVKQILDGFTFIGQKNKYRYENEKKDRIYTLTISSINELQELMKALSDLTE